jgi:hypothetical protein
MENVATYSEARSEYTKQLATFIVPSIVGWFQTLWGRNASDRQRCLSAFQNECEEVSRWNQDRIHDEVRVLLERSGCDYMEELMTAVFVAHTKVLTAVRLSTKQKKLSITVPKLDHFIHRVFRESARCFWKTPFLFMAEGGVVERQKNLLQIEALASEAITTAVRGLLPVKQILQDYLDEDEEEEVVEDETVPVPAAPSAPPSEEEVKPEPEPEVKDVSENEFKEISAAVEPESKPPAVVSIDTEPTVHFSDYDSVFDEEKGKPEIRYSPKEGEEDDEDAPSDALVIDEASSTPVAAEDVEDLEAPAPVKKDTISDEEVVVLE